MDFGGSGCVLRGSHRRIAWLGVRVGTPVSAPPPFPTLHPRPTPRATHDSPLQLVRGYKDCTDHISCFGVRRLQHPHAGRVLLCNFTQQLAEKDGVDVIQFEACTELLRGASTGALPEELAQSPKETTRLHDGVCRTCGMLGLGVFSCPDALQERRGPDWRLSCPTLAEEGAALAAGRANVDG